MSANPLGTPPLQRTSPLTVLLQAAGSLSLGLQCFYAVAVSLFVAGRWTLDGGPVYLPGVVLGLPIAACFAVASLTMANALRRGLSGRQPTMPALFTLIMTSLVETALFLFVVMTFRNAAGIEQHAYVRELLIGLLPPVTGLMAGAWTVVVDARAYLAGPAE